MLKGDHFLSTWSYKLEWLNIIKTSRHVTNFKTEMHLWKEAENRKWVTAYNNLQSHAQSPMLFYIVLKGLLK